MSRCAPRQKNALPSIGQKNIQALCIALIIFCYAEANSRTLTPNETSVMAIFENMAPLVVNVHNLQNPAAENIMDDAHQMMMASGFLWNDEGYIITNYHVVHGAKAVKVSFGKNESYDVDIIDSSPQRDIAILKLSTLTPIDNIKNTSKDFKQIPIGDSDQLIVGQTALAIGNPFGLERTLTVGVISGVGRILPGFAGVNIHNMVQTDASINPGNSGGPLLNSQGQVIGMNTLIFSKSGTSAGIGFAVPVNQIKRTIEQVIAFGHIPRPGLGFQRLKDELAMKKSLQGVVIHRIIPGSSADKAGLKGTRKNKYGQTMMGDIITRANGVNITNFDDLFNFLDNTAIGETITIIYIRGEDSHTVTLQTMDLSPLMKTSTED